MLNAQYVALAECGAPKELLHAYRAVVRHISRMSQDEVIRLLRPDLLKHREKPEPTAMLPSEATSLSLEDVERLIAEENSSRKTLEAIAIGRFQVPRGSMRSFANIGMLKEKLTTLVQNERAHGTITSLAQHSRS